MKILIVRDSRHLMNWGARSVVPTLSQIARQCSKEVDFLVLPENLIVNTLMPTRFASFFWYRRQYGFSEVYIQAEKAFGAKFSLFETAIDPQEIVAIIKKKRNQIKSLQEIYEKIENSDLIILDGDGDFILSKGRWELTSGLAIIELAKDLGKKAILLNSLIADPIGASRDQNMENYLRNTLSRCDAICLRDMMSLANLKSIAPEIVAKFVPDILFYKYPFFNKQNIDRNLPKNGNFILPCGEMDDKYFDKLDFEQEYICVTGGAGAASRPSEAINAYIRLLKHLSKLQIQIYLTPTCSGDRFLYEVSERTGIPIVPVSIPVNIGGAILANAKLFVTGRYHPSILASFGGTPSIFLDADCHKSSSLLTLLGYHPEDSTYSYAPTQEECERIYLKACDYLSNYTSISMRIIENVETRYNETNEYSKVINSFSLKNQTQITNDNDLLPNWKAL